MTVVTKYSEGDTVWIMENDRATTKRILGVRVHHGQGTYSNAGGNRTSVEYYARSGIMKEGDCIYYRESVLYPTKEELLKSL